MAKSQKLDLLLDELHAIRGDPASAAAALVLRKALRGASGYAAAKAAQIIAEGEVFTLTADLVAAFERFCINPVKTDPGCRAKAAIAESLYGLAYDDAALFLRGITYRQMEPVYGGRSDTATDLRANCAFGLLRMNYHEALIEVSDLLADPEAPVRGAAAQALAYSGMAEAVPVLRLKALSGDPEPAVLGECLGALLKLAPQSSLPFSAKFLDHDNDAFAEAAALALGTSRLSDAFPILRQWWERSVATLMRRTALLAIAMLRRDDALAFLMHLLATAEPPDARDAISALRIYRHDDLVRQQVLDTLQQRGETALLAIAEKQFGDG